MVGALGAGWDGVDRAHMFAGEPAVLDPEDPRYVEVSLVARTHTHTLSHTHTHTHIPRTHSRTHTYTYTHAHTHTHTHTLTHIRAHAHTHTHTHSHTHTLTHTHTHTHTRGRQVRRGVTCCEVPRRRCSSEMDLQGRARGDQSAISGRVSGVAESAMSHSYVT